MCLLWVVFLYEYVLWVISTILHHIMFLDRNYIYSYINMQEQQKMLEPLFTNYLNSFFQ